jgi:predicted tellurium resistance membrane protein TerC
VHEIHGSLEGEDEDGPAIAVAANTFGAIIAQIAIIDIVFSLDSVITAVGLVDEVEIMIIAILLAVAVMMFAAGPIGRFVDAHPTIKMLALSFLVLVGVALVAEGWGFHIPKGYVYFSMAFAIGVEMLNLRVRKNQQRKAPVKLRQRGQFRQRPGLGKIDM